jgi:hypothetical protein
MAKMVLFLLKPGFTDDKGGPWFCPGCAGVEGFLKYAPEVERQIEVRRVDFPRPRKEIVELVGTESQGCPVLVLAKGVAAPPEAKTSLETGRTFIANTGPICEFLGRTFGVVRPHP